MRLLSPSTFTEAEKRVFMLSRPRHPALSQARERDERFFSGEIKEQRLGWLGGFQREHARLLGARTVARCQRDIVKCQSAFGDLQPRAAASLEFVRHRLAGLEPNAIDLRVLMDFRRAAAAVRRNNECFQSVALFRVWMPLGVAWNETPLTGLNPDLQEVERFGAARIELAVGNATTGAHELNLARLERAAVAHAVLVLQRAFEHVAEDLHVAMSVCAETLAGRDAVIIDDSQRAEAHVRRIVIIGEGERMMRVKPTVVGVTPFICPPDVQSCINHFHTGKMLRWCDSGQCKVLGLSLS